MEIPRVLQQILPHEQVSDRPADLDEVSRDESTLPPVRPAAVVWPRTTEEVAKVVRWAQRERVPLTARGAGTSLEGNSIPAAGGIVVSFRDMKRVLEVSTADLLVRVEPGIVYADLNRRLRDTGLFFPPSPGGSAETASVGGMVATNASGLYALRYGATRDHVRALTVVTALGDVVRVGSRAPKSSSGYHLVGLFVGSEGTLGVVTEVTLSLTPRPETSRAAAYRFPSDEGAAALVPRLVQGAPEMAALELMDARSLGAAGRFLGLPAPEAPCLFLEAQGSGARVEESMRFASEAAVAAGGAPLEIPGTSPWRFREKATESIRAAHPGAAIVRTDLGLPLSRLAEGVSTARSLAEGAGVPLYVFGHAGLGILHLLMPVSPDSAPFERAKEAKDRMVVAALALGGTCSAEHGIGLGNRRYLAREHGGGVELMRAIKRALDPSGILNPGKVL